MQIKYSMCFLLLLAASFGGATSLALSCSRNDPSASSSSTKTVTDDDDEKPKKKKKKADDEDEQSSAKPTSSLPSNETPTLTRPISNVGVKASGSPASNDADKQKLIRCCSALRKAAQAAGVASTMASGIPGLPTLPTNKGELDKAVDSCDKQVADWTGNLNKSLSTLKGSTQLALPQACSL